MKLGGNTVLVTGGASGIGFALAQALLRRGNTVIVCGRTRARLLEAQRAEPALHVRVCDVADEGDRRSLFAWVSSRFPALNVLVNNAGVQRDIDFTRGLDEFLAGENEVRINLEAPIVLSGLFVPLLAGKDNAAILNVSSGLGFVPMAALPVYCASKAGVHAWSMALRAQLAGVGIRVVEIVPPAVDTPLNPQGRARRAHFKPALGADEFAAAVLKSLEAGEPEIGYGGTEKLIRASRAEIDQRFAQMNGLPGAST